MLVNELNFLLSVTHQQGVDPWRPCHCCVCTQLYGARIAGHWFVSDREHWC